MKMTITEYKSQLDLAKPLTGIARKTVLDMLKGAEVTDDKGNALDVQIIEMPTDAAPEAKTVEQATKDADKTTQLTAETVERLVQKGIDAALKANPAKNPLNENPENKTVTRSIPATVRAITPKNFLGKTINGRDPAERAYRFGQWAMATMGRGDAMEFCKAQGISIVQKVATEGTNTAGGFLVPEEFGQDIIELKEMYGVFRKYADVVPMSGDTLTEPRRTGGLTAYPVAETAAGTESTMTWDQVRLVAKDWMVLTRITNQINADSIIRWADRLAYECGYAFATKEDDCGFNGDGTSTYAGIQGVTTRLSTVFSTSGGTGLIAATGTGYATNWASVTMGDLNRVIGALPQYADTPRCSWFCSKAFHATVMQRLELAAGGNTASEIQNGARVLKFAGYPVVIAQKLPVTSAVSQVACLFGDLSLAAMFGDRQQDAISFSEHASVGGQSVFERNELAVRGTERFDINVHDVGVSGTAGPMVGLVTASS